MTSREKFEATANDTIRRDKTFFVFNKKPDGRYVSELTAQAFLDWEYAWQAAERDALRAEKLEREPAGHFIPKTTNAFGKVTEWDQVWSPHGTPLYLAPGAGSVPMTEIEIFEAVDDSDLDWQKGFCFDADGQRNRYVDLIRTVEAHHKIGLKP